MAATKQRITSGALPRKPHGSNCCDLEVFTISTRSPGFTITGGEANRRIKVQHEDVFPLVQGLFGTLAVPLPRTAKLLYAEFGRNWNSKIMVKCISGSKRSWIELPAGGRRRIWPSVPMLRCGPLLHRCRGAGVLPIDADVQWSLE